MVAAENTAKKTNYYTVSGILFSLSYYKNFYCYNLYLPSEIRDSYEAKLTLARQRVSSQVTICDVEGPREISKISQGVNVAL